MSTAPKCALIPERQSRPFKPRLAGQLRLDCGAKCSLSVLPQPMDERPLSTAAASRGCGRSPFWQNREAGLRAVFRGVIVRSVCIAILLIVCAGAAGAATIEIEQPENGPPLVFVTGDFEFSDVADFNAT